jgi:hypothetical protein
MNREDAQSIDEKSWPKTVTVRRANRSGKSVALDRFFWFSAMPSKTCSIAETQVLRDANRFCRFQRGRFFAFKTENIHRRRLLTPSLNISSAAARTEAPQGVHRGVTAFSREWLL